MKKHIVKLIELNDSIRSKEKAINDLFRGDFSVDPNCELENIILDMMGVPEEGHGRSAEYTHFNDCDPEEYGFCRDYFTDILFWGSVADEDGKIVDKNLTAEQKYEQIKKELAGYKIYSQLEEKK